MHEHCQYVVLAINSGKVITETSRVNSASLSCQHLYYVIFQAIEIHLYIVSHSIIGSSCSPVTFAPLVGDRFHYRTWVKDG